MEGSEWIVCKDGGVVESLLGLFKGELVNEIRLATRLELEEE